VADIKFLDFSNDLLAQGTMDADELLEFRRMTGKDFEISSNEADILFKVNNTVETPDDWPEYFINAISHYLLNQMIMTALLSLKQNLPCSLAYSNRLTM